MSMSTLCEWLTETRFSPACGLSRTFLAVLTCCGLSRCWCTAPVPSGSADLCSVSFSVPLPQESSDGHDHCATCRTSHVVQHPNSRTKQCLARWANARIVIALAPLGSVPMHSLGVSMKCALGSELVVTHGAVVSLAQRCSNRLLRRSSVIDSKRCTVFTVCDQRSSSLINGDSNSGGSAMDSNATAFQAKCMSSRTRTIQAGNRWFTACDSMARRANGCVRLVRSAYLNRPRIMMQSYEGARCFR